MPSTWPEALTSEPPESPGSMPALISMRPDRVLRVPAVVVAGGDRLAEGGDRTTGRARRSTRATGVTDPDHRLADGGGAAGDGDGLEAAGVDQLDDGHVAGAVVAHHVGRVRLAVAHVGHADAGGPVDHVVVGQDHAVGGEDHAGSGCLLVLVAEVGVDVHQAGVNLGGDGGDVRRRSGAGRGVARGTPRRATAEG